MQELDKILDTNPTKKTVAEMAETRIRNLQCFRELEALNNFGKFMGKHPLLEDYSERKQYEKLYLKSKSDFMKEYTKISSYIARYNSYLNNRKATEEQKKKWQQHVAHYTRLERILIEIMER